NYDPRARVSKNMADQVFEVTGKNPPSTSRSSSSGSRSRTTTSSGGSSIRTSTSTPASSQAMKFPVDMFPVLFAIPRMSGWLAQWEEMVEDREQKIARPRQVYTGAAKRDFVHIDERAKALMLVGA